MKPIQRGALALVGILAAGGALAEQTRTLPGLPRPVSDADFRSGLPDGADAVELGRLLFFDPILSGNRNISCATCHHPSLGTSDGLALGLGEGAAGLGTNRRTGNTPASAVHARIPRNSPALFNLGAAEFTTMFHDGRVEVDTAGYYESGFISPARWKLPPGLNSALAAQAMFPVGSPEEMAGQRGENPVADAVVDNRMAGPGGVWDLLAQRLRENPEYVSRFRRAFPDQVRAPGDITFVMAANAIAAFEADAFRTDGSPFDEFLRGSNTSLSEYQLRGMGLFYGKGGCAACHSGPFLTDHQFHSVAMPQLGPGKSDGRDAEYWRASGEKAFVEDLGRGRVTDRPEDNFRFRTPSLRNVAVTGPWGHAGAYDSLEEVVRHHMNPVASLERYRVDPNRLPTLGSVVEETAFGSAARQEWLTPQRLAGFLLRDSWVQDTPELRGRIAAANEFDGVDLTDQEVRDLLAFLESLTDPATRDMGWLVPPRVPSGLKIDR